MGESHTPRFYKGFAEFLSRFRGLGGKVAVISHSPAEVIARHYAAHSRAAEIRPDFILGWDTNPERRKPSAWPALHALQQLGVAPDEAVVLDDLSPGIRMARAAGIQAAAAGWGHAVPTIQQDMRHECDHYLSTVDE